MLDPWVSKIPRGGNGTPLQYSCLENSMSRRVWQATIQGLRVHTHTHTYTHTHTHNQETDYVWKEFCYHYLLLCYTYGVCRVVLSHLILLLSKLIFPSGTTLSSGMQKSLGLHFVQPEASVNFLTGLLLKNMWTNILFLFPHNNLNLSLGNYIINCKVGNRKYLPMGLVLH